MMVRLGTPIESASRQDLGQESAGERLDLRLHVTADDRPATLVRPVPPTFPKGKLPRLNHLEARQSSMLQNP
jgi:hypothetical protein